MPEAAVRLHRRTESGFVFFIERIEETSLDAIERIEPGTPEGIEEAE